MLLQVRDLSAYPHGAKSGFSANVGVCACYYCLDFGEQVPGHFDGGDVSKGAECKADGVLVGVVQITARVSAVTASRYRRMPYFFRELVTSVRTSWFSSSSSMVPR